MTNRVLPMIVYEQPLSEKIRLFLRLELLVERFQYHLERERRSDAVSALITLLELYNLSARIDLKSDVIKETDRMAQSVRRVVHGTESQDKILEQLTDCSNQLYQLRGALGQHLRTNVFFSTLLQRASLPGGINGFDIPLLSFWLEKNAAERAEDLRQWCKPYVKTAEAATYLLRLIRDYCDYKEHMAKDGFFQMSLGMGQNYQLLQVCLPDDAAFYPEISAGKQRFSLRFVAVDVFSERGQQVRDSVPFKLKLCAF